MSSAQRADRSLLDRVTHRPFVVAKCLNFHVRPCCFRRRPIAWTRSSTRGSLCCSAATPASPTTHPGPASAPGTRPNSCLLPPLLPSTLSLAPSPSFTPPPSLPSSPPSLSPVPFVSLFPCLLLSSYRAFPLPYPGQYLNCPLLPPFPRSPLPFLLVLTRSLMCRSPSSRSLPRTYSISHVLCHRVIFTDSYCTTCVQGRLHGVLREKRHHSRRVSRTLLLQVSRVLHAQRRVHLFYLIMVISFSRLCSRRTFLLANRSFHFTAGLRTSVPAPTVTCRW